MLRHVQDMPVTLSCCSGARAGPSPSSGLRGWRLSFLHTVLASLAWLRSSALAEWCIGGWFIRFASLLQVVTILEVIIAHLWRVVSPGRHRLEGSALLLSSIGLHSAVAVVEVLLVRRTLLCHEVVAVIALLASLRRRPGSRYATLS